MRAVSDSGGDPAFLSHALNMMPTDPVAGGPYVRRFSLRDLGADGHPIRAAGVAMQYVGIFRKRSGWFTVAILGGEVWKFDGNTTWTKVLSTAQLVAGGVTLDAAADCYAITFTDKLVINDGTNSPFLWDGTAGAGLTVLTNAPAKCFGRPAVYYGKLFFIKDVAANSADRSTIVWSEENQPNTGYEALIGGVQYSNVWQLSQSGAGALTILLGTNDALYYFRESAIGAIRGAANSTFVAAGTHDSISIQYGCTSPRAAILYGDGIWFMDQRGRPFYLPLGGKPQPLWYDLGDFYNATSDFVLPASTSPQGIIVNRGIVVPIPWYDAVAFCPYSVVGNVFFGDWYIFSARTIRAVSHWTPRTSVAHSLVGEGYAQSWSMGIIVTLYSDGANIAHTHGPDNQTLFWGNEAGVVWSLETQPLGAEASELEYQLQELSAHCLWWVSNAGDEAGGVTIAAAVTQPAAGAGTGPNFGSEQAYGQDLVLKNDVLKKVGQRRLVWAGPSAESRWLQAKFTFTLNSNNNGQVFGVERIAMRVQPIPLSPGTT
jgi:hypothetical protein